MNAFRCAVGCATVAVNFLVPAAGAMLSTGADAAPAAAAPVSMRARHVPAVVANGLVAPTGEVDLRQRLQLSLELPLRNRDELKKLMHDLYDPKSPLFHQYLSVAQFTDRFGPTPSDYDAVVAWARKSGLKVTNQAPNRHLVAVEGTTSVVNAAFNVHMTNYRHPTENRTFFAPDREPVPVGLAVPLARVAGMDNVTLPRFMASQKPSGPVGAAAAANTPVASVNGSGPFGQYLPSDMRKAYYGTGPLTGAGQSIAIFSFDGYLASDLQLYYSRTGMSTNVPVVNRLVNGYDGVCRKVTNPTSSVCEDGEQILDIVNAIGMAPGITQILFYEGNSPEWVLNQIAVDNIAKSISSSWSWSAAHQEDYWDDYYIEYYVQGQTYLNATGDFGAYNSGPTTFYDTFMYPETNEYITQVGGTVLTTNGAGGAWTGESAWSRSGGGYVGVPAIPGYQDQTGVIFPANHGDSCCRNSPDIAAEADFDNVTVNNGVFSTGWGGTSFAAPRWAGIIAMANQQAVAQGTGTVGFINPLLYSLGVERSLAFHDITSGSSVAGSSLTQGTVGTLHGYDAVSGYDLVTGWGSPNGAAMINALTN